MKVFHTFLIALVTIVPAHRDVEGDVPTIILTLEYHP